MRLHPKHGLNPTIPTCFICGKDKNEVILLGNAYKDEAPRHMVMNKMPCDACKSLMKQGIILISVRESTDKDNPYRTGGWCVVKEEAAVKIFNDAHVLKSRIAFVEDGAWDRIGLPRPEAITVP